MLVLSWISSWICTAEANNYHEDAKVFQNMVGLCSTDLIFCGIFFLLMLAAGIINKQFLIMIGYGLGMFLVPILFDIFVIKDYYDNDDRKMSKTTKNLAKSYVVFFFLSIFVAILFKLSITDKEN